MIKTLKTILFFIASIFVVTTNAQKLNEVNVPALVKTKFVSLYPNAKSGIGKRKMGNTNLNSRLKRLKLLFCLKQTEHIFNLRLKFLFQLSQKGARDYISKNLPGKKVDEKDDKDEDDDDNK